MDKWDRRSPDDWARILGMVSIPMFGRARSPGLMGRHYVLLDGDTASFSLSVGDADSLESNSSLLGWSWSSNLPHSLVIDDTSDELIVKKWSDPESIRRFALPDAAGANEIVESLASEPIPPTTVIAKMLRVFRQVRVNVEERGGINTDVIIIFNSLLDISEAVRSGAVTSLDTAAEAMLKETTTPLADFPVVALLQELIREDQDTSYLLDADLLIRHASGYLYQEAHMELNKARSRSYPLFHDLVSLDAIRSTGATRRDIHFTPPSLARALVQEGIREIQGATGSPRRIRVLDPACGSGVFLVEALRELRASHVVDVRIQGIDISPVSCIMTQYCLEKSTHEDENLRPSIKVTPADSLRLDDWGVHDLILMNPPFISNENMSYDERKRVRSILSGIGGGRSDMSFAFVAKALKSLAEGGALAMLVPPSFLAGESAKWFRLSIANDPSLQIRLLGQFKGYNYFRGATVAPAILVITKSSVGDNRSRGPSRILYAWDGSEDRSIRALRRGVKEAQAIGWEIDEIDPSTFKSFSWEPQPRRVEKFCELLTASGVPRVNDVFEVRQGIRTGYNSVFLVKSSEVQRFANSNEAWSLFKPTADRIADGRLVENEYVFYPYNQNGSINLSENEIAATVPLFFTEKLLGHRRPLTNRKGLGKNPWWALTRPHNTWQPKIRPKIVCKTFGGAGSFAFDGAGVFAVVQGLAWFLRGEKYSHLYNAYISILNSRLFSYLLGVFCPKIRGGQYNLYANYVRRVFLPDLADTTRHSDEYIRELSTMGENISAGRMIDSERQDALVALTYGYPLSRFRAAFAPELIADADRIFSGLSVDWKKAQKYLSNSFVLTESPVYRQLVAMGEMAIPFILRDMKSKLSHWNLVLEGITGENPVDERLAGKTREVVDAWLAWGKNRGYEFEY